MLIAGVVHMRRYGISLVRWYKGLGHHRYQVIRWLRFAPAQYGHLATWFSTHGRHQPWRQAGVSPWALLVAEMLLRRTTSRQVEKVWPQLVDRYPTPAAFLGAPTADVERLMEPLGLAHLRTAAVREAALALTERHDGEVPAAYDELLALPHVGPYTARAVRCFALGVAEPIVDVNILRILERYFGVSTLTHNPHREPHVWMHARKLLPDDNVAQYQYALLDLSALVCRKTRPLCEECPIRSGCRAYRQAKLGKKG